MRHEAPDVTKALPHNIEAEQAIPFVDWRVQVVLVVFLLLLAAYAIFTMPQAKAKLEKLVDAL